MEIRGMTIKVNKSYLLFIALFYFFLLRDWFERNIPFIGYGDELIALLAFPLFIFDYANNHHLLRIDHVGYNKYVVVFLGTGLLSSIIYRYQDFITITCADAFLCIKFWLAIYVGKKLFVNFNMERFGRKIYVHVKLITCLFLLMFIVDQILKIFPANIRYGIRSTQLIYSHSTVFAACCMFLVMVLLAVRDYVIGYKKYLVILLFLMCATLRSKAFGSAFAIILICYFVFFRKKRFRLRTIIIFIPLIIALGWEQIQYYFFSSIQDDSARYQLLFKSLEIAKDYFPIGTGFGTFASYYSGVEYSPIYRMYGLENINGLRLGETSFISDSFWPMVLGQTGVIGVTAYILALLFLFKAIQNIREISMSYYASALCGICYLLIASVAESAFVHPVAIPIAVMIGFLSSQKE